MCIRDSLHHRTEVERSQRPLPLAEGMAMTYTAEEIAAVVDHPPNRILELRKLGIIAVAPNVLLQRPDTQTRCCLPQWPIKKARRVGV